MLYEVITLDEIAFLPEGQAVVDRIGREFEDDDVAALGIADRQETSVDKRELGAVNELVDQQMIADQQRILHGARRDLEGLDNEGA